MDNQKVAKELVAIAKQLTAGEGVGEGHNDEMVTMISLLNKAIASVVDPAILRSSPVQESLQRFVDSIINEQELAGTESGAQWQDSAFSGEW